MYILNRDTRHTLGPEMPGSGNVDMTIFALQHHILYTYPIQTFRILLKEALIGFFIMIPENTEVMQPNRPCAMVSSTAKCRLE